MHPVTPAYGLVSLALSQRPRDDGARPGRIYYWDREVGGGASLDHLLTTPDCLWPERQRRENGFFQCVPNRQVRLAAGPMALYLFFDLRPPSASPRAEEVAYYRRLMPFTFVKLPQPVVFTVSPLCGDPGSGRPHGDLFKEPFPSSGWIFPSDQRMFLFSILRLRLTITAEYPSPMAALRKPLNAFPSFCGRNYFMDGERGDKRYVKYGRGLTKTRRSRSTMNPA